MNMAETLLNDLKLFITEEKEEEKKCPKCGSTNIKQTIDGFKCDDCDETWDEKDDSSEDDQENDDQEEGDDD